MENRIVFREMLTTIKEKADEAGGRITREEVRKILSGMPLEQEHYEMIYTYLAGQNILVADTAEELEDLPAQEEGHSLSIYLEELSAIGGEMEEKEQMLLQAVILGDDSAKEQLIECYLPLVCEVAQEYEGDEMMVEDLIQEGNIGLLLAVNELDLSESPAACRARILNGISKAMEAAIQENKDLRHMGEGMVSRVNHLNEAVKNLEEDLGRKISPEELSAYLEMPMAEIQDILRLSGDQIELEGENGKKAGERKNTK